MESFKPDKYTSVQAMLRDLGFLYYEPEEQFGKGEVKFPASAIVGHSPSTFYALMEAKGWLKEGEQAPANYFEAMQKMFGTGMDMRVVPRGFVSGIVYNDGPDRTIQGGDGSLLTGQEKTILAPIPPLVSLRDFLRRLVDKKDKEPS